LRGLLVVWGRALLPVQPSNARLALTCSTEVPPLEIAGGNQDSIARIFADEDLLCRDRIKFARRFFIEDRALFRIAAAPVLMSSGNP
jgi:hypothetical protein